ncbi:MAG: hypothetical protein QOE90_3132 [Thermoplasmata archaeon]|jgi:hypothetical protein|nr:hypothetical protein [Thermoplasmata archaeon]
MRSLLLVALLATPVLAALATPTASATCATQDVTVNGQVVASLLYDAPSKGGPICITRLTVYECSATTTTDLARVLTCSSTPFVVL